MKKILISLIITAGLLLSSLLCMGSGYAQPVVNDDLKQQITKAVVSYLQAQGTENMKSFKVDDAQINSIKVVLILQHIYYDTGLAEKTTNFNEFNPLFKLHDPISYTCVIQGVSGTQAVKVEYRDTKLEATTLYSSGDIYTKAYNKLNEKFGGKNLDAYLVPEQAGIVMMKDGNTVLFQPLGMGLENDVWSIDVDSLPILTGDEFYKVIMPIIRSYYKVTNPEDLKTLPLGGGTDGVYQKSFPALTFVIIACSCLLLLAGVVLIKQMVLKKMALKK